MTFGGLRDSLRAQPAAWLLVSVFALLPFGRSAELPLLVMAVLGLPMLRDLLERDASAPRIAGLVFAAYWLPELVSALDSVAPSKSWTEVAADLRFLPFLLYAQRGLAVPGASARVLQLCGLVLALWCVDALVQAGFGFSLGGANRSDRLSGIFGDDNLKLGGVMAALSPLLLLPAQARFGWRGFAVAATALLLVILLAGARAAWASYALVLGLLLWRAVPSLKYRLAGVGAAVLLALAAGLALQAGSERFAERVERSAAAFSGDPAELDRALSFRLPIWRAALSMIAQHPFNGVGVRGFRYAYPEHAEADDRFLQEAGEDGFGAYHAHQIVLEILSETGGFGLLCWLLGLGFALHYARQQSLQARCAAWPATLVLIALLFPLNTHYAVYSSFQSLLLFAALALWLGALGSRPRASVEAAKPAPPPPAG